MRTRARLCFAVAIATLASCARMEPLALPPPQPLPVNCKAGDCTVRVTVDGCHKDKIHVDREPLVVDRRYSGPIDWDLVTPGYTFAKNGIDILQGVDNEFDTEDRKPRKFKWNNKHRDYKTYKYSINVVPDGQTRPCTKDPSIMN